jgi:hypothetical protein
MSQVLVKRIDYLRRGIRYLRPLVGNLAVYAYVLSIVRNPTQSGR